MLVALVTMAPRRGEAGCGNIRELHWNFGLPRPDGAALFLWPESTGTWTQDRAGLREPMFVGVWEGDDHSRLIVFEHDISPGPTVTGTWLELAWGRTDNTGFRAVSPGMPAGAQSVRSTDIGYCSSPLVWSATDGTGFADQLGQGLEEEIETPSLVTGDPEDPSNYFYATILEGPEYAVRFGTAAGPIPSFSRDDLCVRMAFRGSVPRIFCHIDRVDMLVCGRPVMAPADNAAPGQRDAVFVFTELKVDTFSEVPVSSAQGQPGCSPIHQALVADAIEERLRDPEEGLGAGIAGAINDALWVRGAFGAAVLGTCVSLPPADQEDACRVPLNLVGVDVRVRCDPGDDSLPASCIWNLEADRIELIPSRLEIVLAHDATEPTVDAIRAVGGTIVEPTLCRNGPLETGQVTGALGWQSPVLL